MKITKRELNKLVKKMVEEQLVQEDNADAEYAVTVFSNAYQTLTQLKNELASLSDEDKQYVKKHIKMMGASESAMNDLISEIKDIMH